MIHKKTEIHPTLKISVSKGDELAVLFKDCRVTLQEIKQIPTTYGLKDVATVTLKDELYDVFMNKLSINNLIDFYGDNDDDWKGKVYELKKEVDKKYKKEMIVFYPQK